MLTLEKQGQEYFLNKNWTVSSILIRYDILEDDLKNYKLAQGIVACLQEMADNHLLNCDFYAEDCSGKNLDIFIEFELFSQFEKWIDVENTIKNAIETANIFAD